MLDGAAQTKRNNLLASVVDVVSIFLLANVIITLFGVKDLSSVAVCIVDTGNSVLPRCPHESITFGQELMLRLESFVLIELCTNILNLLTSFTGHSESGRLRFSTVECFARLI